MLALHIANIGESLYNNNLMLSKQNISEYFHSEDNNTFNTIFLKNFPLRTPKNDNNWLLG